MMPRIKRNTCSDAQGKKKKDLRWCRGRKDNLEEVPRDAVNDAVEVPTAGSQLPNADLHMSSSVP